MYIILQLVARVRQRGDSGPIAGWWPAEEEGADSFSRLVPITDYRDWANQIHVGRRFLRQGLVDPPEPL